MIIRRIMEEGTSDRYRDGEFSKDYSVLNELGRGRFAVVRRCEHRSTKQHFAAKFIKKRKMGRDCRDDILKEIRILEMSTDHPRLIGLHEVYESATEVILVLEFAIGGELHPYCVADRDGSFTERDAVRLLYQILEGVKYLHDQNIVHLDLKPQNILLTNEEIRQSDIKLIDFGIAKCLNKDLEVREILGTVDYVAPEVLNFEPISLATDMWSVGVVAYVMLTGISPFVGDSKQETYLNISQVNLDFPEEHFKDISVEARDFIEALCVLEPTQRLTAADCISHPLFSKHLSDGVLTSSTECNSHCEDADMSYNESETKIVDMNISLNSGFRRLMGPEAEISTEKAKIISDGDYNKFVVCSERVSDDLMTGKELRTNRPPSDSSGSTRVPDVIPRKENPISKSPVKEHRINTPSSSSKISSSSNSTEIDFANAESRASIESGDVNKSGDFSKLISIGDKEQQLGELFTFTGMGPRKPNGSSAEKLHVYHKGDSPFIQRRVLHHGKENLINDITPEPKRCKVEV